MVSVQCVHELDIFQTICTRFRGIFYGENKLIGWSKYDIIVIMQAKQGEKRCVFLLDEALAIEKIECISGEVCTEIAERVCEESFRRPYFTWNSMECHTENGKAGRNCSIDKASRSVSSCQI